MIDFSSQYDKYLNRFNNQLDLAIKSLDSAPDLLKEAMAYAVMGGGKRVRPVLLYATADILDIDLSLVDHFAVAIECIHSYSLVHDDLPAMDNDDYRRGKLSTHKKFGEAYGILTGDSLLNFAFEYCLSKENFSPNDAKALKLLANYAGTFGMIAGQVYDLQNEKSSNVNKQTLYTIYHNKTAKLLTAPMLIASILANNKYYDNFEKLGYNLGIMFQISDDIMDVEGTVESIGKTPNKDLEEDKLTSIKVFGLDGAKQMREHHYLECIKQLSDIKNCDFLTQFCKKMYERTK